METLVLERQKNSRGLAALCIGVGQGIAISHEAV